MPFEKGHKGYGTKESYIARGKKISRSLNGRKLSEASKLKRRIHNAIINKAKQG